MVGSEQSTQSARIPPQLSSRQSTSASRRVEFLCQPMREATGCAIAAAWHSELCRLRVTIDRSRAGRVPKPVEACSDRSLACPAPRRVQTPTLSVSTAEA